MPTPVKLPALGENIDSADVVNVLVAPGETVAKDQPLLEVETGKASVEIPSPASGVVKDVLAKTGDTVAVGGTILTLEGADNTAAASAPDGAGCARCGLTVMVNCTRPGVTWRPPRSIRSKRNLLRTFARAARC